MNREEIEKLEAGPEMDALITEKVMKWEKITIEYVGSDEETPRQKELAEWTDKVGIESIGDYFINVDQNFWIECEDFSPSTNMSAAWQVGEYLIERGELTISNGDGDSRDVDFLPKGKSKLIQVSEKTTSLALCRVALLDNFKPEKA